MRAAEDCRRTAGTRKGQTISDPDLASHSLMREADRDQVREKVRPNRNEYLKQLDRYVLPKKRDKHVV